jgi:2-polyprenyl-6-methoxyphenol hydroxylase-like FAD-dependent oxidoreductase
MKIMNTQVCIIGAGPGGAALGLLLARSGIEVIVVERSKTHQREFRGEFISPDSVEILESLQVINQLEKSSYLENEGMELYDAGKLLLKLNFTEPGRLKPIDIPQPTLLETIVKESKKYDNYTYLNATSAKRLIVNNHIISGVICQSENSELTIYTQLVVGADGRYGKVRKLADLPANQTPIERDFVWFNLPRPTDWPEIIRLKLYKNYQLMILPTFPNLLRVGFNIPKGKYSQLLKQDISELHKLVAQLEPQLADTVKNTISHWSQTSLLDIFTTTLPDWSRDGLVLIGDAAHTLTPVLGQGVNHAISDAVVLSNTIKKFLKQEHVNVVPKVLLKQFEEERRPEINFIQRFQLRQEKMMRLQSACAVKCRWLFYQVISKTVLKNIMLKKIFYRKLKIAI